MIKEFLVHHFDTQEERVTLLCVSSKKQEKNCRKFFDVQ